ncbi:DUF1573 domain-containing protein [Hufsiella ginkgonis]|uniref:DUF1573 domain-containing protein n=1 Tax=Hufsiella ginkgonis TaxID=2695274 RepID=A0A7K1XTG9_9SPHI|nr:DUF1573 domain-containing protein [Hufsiella ginkgonis]MXV14069.1 DUF1573 domain-containing protein [Hufsiella ginkgonis]
MKITLFLLFLASMVYHTGKPFNIKDENIAIVLKHGAKKKVVVPVKNAGEMPLIIYDVISMCGCTVARAPKLPIKKNETQPIVLEVNSSNRAVGKGQVFITVIANTPNKYSKIVLNLEVVK